MDFEVASQSLNKYVIVDWYFQQHGSFSSGGRWRDISLKEFSSTEQITAYLCQYIKQNYPYVTNNNEQHSVLDLCHIAINESRKLLDSNKQEISRVTSRYIWPINHKLIMGCLVNAHIVATCNDRYLTNLENRFEEEENNTRNYCLIVQLGNNPTHVKFVRGTDCLRKEIFKRFQNPFKTCFIPTKEQYDVFFEKCYTLSIQALCNYVANQHWHQLDRNLHGIIVDFIIAGDILYFDQ